MLAHLNRGFSDLFWLKFVFCHCRLRCHRLWTSCDDLEIQIDLLSYFAYYESSDIDCSFTVTGADPGIYLGEGVGGWGPILARGLGTAYRTYLYLTNSNDCQKIRKLVLSPPDWQQSSLDECTFFLFFLSLFLGGGVRWVWPRLNLHLNFVLKFVETRLFITY